MEFITTASLVAAVIGVVIGFLIAKLNHLTSATSEKEKFNQLDLEFVELATKSEFQKELWEKTFGEKDQEIQALKTVGRGQATEIKELSGKLATSDANLNSANNSTIEKKKEFEDLKSQFSETRNTLDQTKQNLAKTEADNKFLNEKLATQKIEIEKLHEKFNLEFKNIATTILDANATKFADQNKVNLNHLLEPLGKNIAEFKTRIEEVYLDETKERFSLKSEIKNLVDLNKIMSDETRNLTKALKGESKTQGRWGEMILESILERSGLVKGEQYVIESQLTDADGKPLRSYSEDKKMRPDAVITYPDNRHVIIDSKVSLNAFTRLLASDDIDTQQYELLEHISAIKAHINSLSKKGYDDYDKALDFVMLFVPSEPAYIAALQGDPDLWNYAYELRVLLLSPTNLITSLKLIVDLWKREYQNQNAKEIADRGAKLYDKFYGFMENMKAVGVSLDKAKLQYNGAFGQLGSLVTQSTQLKALGLKTKKNLPDLGLPASFEIEELPVEE